MTWFKYTFGSQYKILTFFSLLLLLQGRFFFNLSLALAATVADFENVPPTKALMAGSVWPVLIIQCQFKPPIKSLLSANCLIYVGAINISEMKIILNQYLYSVCVCVRLRACVRVLMRCGWYSLTRCQKNSQYFYRSSLHRVWAEEVLAWPGQKP